jgi:GGDEF domain-containing protein
VTALLPTRAELLDRLAEEMPSADSRPRTLLLVGLRRRDDGWPIPPAALARITTLMANGLRGEDWLARSGPTEFAVLVAGPLPGAQAAADRMLAAINAEAVHGMSAAAGLAALVPGLAASEVLRRATLCLTTARTMGAGRVITYSGTR